MEIVRSIGSRKQKVRDESDSTRDLGYGKELAPNSSGIQVFRQH